MTNLKNGREPVPLWLAAQVAAQRERGVSALDAVVHCMREARLAGQLATGAVLPPLEHLSAELGVSLATVYRALERLAVEGDLVRQGRRFVVAGDDRAVARALAREYVRTLLERRVPLDMGRSAVEAAVREALHLS
jgi:DNA-binding transcriptional MocR family regulator